MSFTREAKEEILLSVKFNQVSIRSFISAIIHTSGAINFSRDKTGFEVTSELKPLITRIIKEVRKVYDRELKLDNEKKAGKRELVTASFDGKKAAEILSDLKILKDAQNKDINFGIDESLIADDNMIIDEAKKRAYITGAFLGCGYVTVPIDGARGYHLEFAFNNAVIAADFYELLCEKGLFPKRAARKEKELVYFKDVESISDLLAYLGAMNSVIRLSEILVSRQTINLVNRQTNCQMANIDKSIVASEKQIQAIKYLEKEKGLKYLDKQLREIAKIRVDNEELTLEELGLMCKPPISKSGVNHRLRKLIQIAERLKNGEEI